LAQAKKAQEFDAIKFDVTKRIVQAVMTAGGAAMGVGVLYWIKNL
jgi:hypothetical protein